MYADDFNISHSAVEVADLERLLQSDVDAVVAWADRKLLSLSPSKSSISFFTPDRARESNVHPQVSIAGQVLPLNKNPKILGVKLDPHFTFGAHVKDVVKSAREKLRILRSLAGSSWGCQKETLLASYKIYVEPTINYASAVWAPNACKSSFDALQKIQNQALRIVTGSLKMSSIDHLHSEAATMPVEDHLEMLSTQFLVNSLRVSHPSHAVVTAPPGPRKMKETLASKFSNKAAPYLVNGITDPSEY